MTLASEEAEIIFYLAEVHAHLGLLRDAKTYAEKYTLTGLRMDLWRMNAMEIIDFAEQEESSYDEDDDGRWRSIFSSGESTTPYGVGGFYKKL